MPGELTINVHARFLWWAKPALWALRFFPGSSLAKLRLAEKIVKCGMIVTVGP